MSIPENFHPKFSKLYRIDSCCKGGQGVKHYVSKGFNKEQVLREYASADWRTPNAAAKP
jgi:hypothetical protein